MPFAFFLQHFSSNKEEVAPAGSFHHLRSGRGPESNQERTIATNKLSQPNEAASPRARLRQQRNVRPRKASRPYRIALCEDAHPMAHSRK